MDFRIRLTAEASPGGPARTGASLDEPEPVQRLSAARPLADVSIRAERKRRDTIGQVRFDFRRTRRHGRCTTSDEAMAAATEALEDYLAWLREQREPAPE